jgi:hypothetical protein
VQEPKIFVVDIGARHKSSAHQLLARDTKVVSASYWRDIEVMHSGYMCMEHELPSSFSMHAKYGRTV